MEYVNHHLVRTRRAILLSVVLFSPALALAQGRVSAMGDVSAQQDASAYHAAKLHNTAAAYRSYLLHCKRCAYRKEAASNHHRLISPQRSSAIASLVGATNSGANLALLRLATPSEQRRVLGIIASADGELPILKAQSKATSRAIEAAMTRRPETRRPELGAMARSATTLSAATRTPIAGSEPARSNNRYFTDSDIIASEPLPIGLTPATASERVAIGPVVQKQSLGLRNSVSTRSLINTETGSLAPRQLHGHKRTVWSLDYHPTGKVLASAGADKKVRLWDVASKETAYSSLNGHQGYIAALDFSNDGKLLASVGGDRSVRLWQWPMGKPLHVLRDALSDVSAVRFSTDGKRLISGADDAGLRVWDVASGKLQQRLKGHDAGITSIAVANNGVDFASGGADGRIITWRFNGKNNAARRQLEIEAHSGLTFDIEFNASASQLYSGGGDGLVRLWDAKSGSAAGVLSGHRGDVTALAATRDGRFLLSGGEDRSVRIWDLEQNRQVQFIATNVGNIYTLALSPSGKRLAVSGSGETVQILHLDLPTS